ncbi:MAG: thioredoxin [Elstera sp.]
MQTLFGASPAPASAPAVKDVTTATFMTEVMEASREAVIVVDFWAPWCGPCKTLGPLLEKAVAETKGSVRMVKINVDENQQLAAQMRVQSIPTVYAFFEGRPVDAFQGALPESQVKAWVKKLASLAAENDPAAQIADALAQAKEALAAGDAVTAQAIYGQILQVEPENVEAIAGMGRMALLAGQIDVAKQVLAQVPKDKLSHSDVLALKSGIELAEQTAELGSRADLEGRLNRDANDHQARYDLALLLYAEGDKQGAVDHLLDLIQRDRAWNEEAGRKQLLKLFEAFGFSDPISVAGRRRLSTLLFR